MITTSSTLEDSATPPTPVILSGEIELFADCLLIELDRAMTSLFTASAQGDYVKRDDVADILLDFRQKIRRQSSHSN